MDQRGNQYLQRLVEKAEADAEQERKAKEHRRRTQMANSVFQHPSARFSVQVERRSLDEDDSPLLFTEEEAFRRIKRETKENEPDDGDFLQPVIAYEEGSNDCPDFGLVSTVAISPPQSPAAKRRCPKVTVKKKANNNKPDEQVEDDPMREDFMLVTVQDTFRTDETHTIAVFMDEPIAPTIREILARTWRCDEKHIEIGINGIAFTDDQATPESLGHDEHTLLPLVAQCNSFAVFRHKPEWNADARAAIQHYARNMAKKKRWIKANHNRSLNRLVNASFDVSYLGAPSLQLRLPDDMSFGAIRYYLADSCGLPVVPEFIYHDDPSRGVIKDHEMLGETIDEDGKNCVFHCR